VAARSRDAGRQEAASRSSAGAGATATGLGMGNVVTASREDLARRTVHNGNGWAVGQLHATSPAVWGPADEVRWCGLMGGSTNGGGKAEICLSPCSNVTLLLI